ncbi:hypothetical protein niasHS_015609 [Heterodera schachtii]|uniref:Secreted protein n=2 Tax=Heterodera TaxID=34509 RepID=A0ABD2HY26_HETSC
MNRGRKKVAVAATSAAAKIVFFNCAAADDRPRTDRRPPTAAGCAAKLLCPIVIRQQKAPNFCYAYRSTFWVDQRLTNGHFLLREIRASRGTGTNAGGGGRIRSENNYCYF